MIIFAANNKSESVDFTIAKKSLESDNISMTKNIPQNMKIYFIAINMSSESDLFSIVNETESANFYIAKIFSESDNFL